MLFDRIPSGYPGADEVFDNIRMGDNVVWQVTELAEYRLFAQPFADRAIADGDVYKRQGCGSAAMTRRSAHMREAYELGRSLK